MANQGDADRSGKLPTLGNQPKKVLSMYGMIEHTTNLLKGQGNLEKSNIPFTLAKIKEQLITELAIATIYGDAKTGITYIFSKYYGKAAYLMYRIPIHQPIPSFDIDIEDLSSQLKHELADLKRSDRRMYYYIIKMAVVHIFENIHFEYFHSSVMRFLKVRFVSQTKIGEPTN